MAEQISEASGSVAAAPGTFPTTRQGAEHQSPYPVRKCVFICVNMDGGGFKPTKGIDEQDVLPPRPRSKT